MKIETLQTAGFKPAITAMRNPMDSWAKSDSVFPPGECMIGPEDKGLSVRLQKSGPEHCKHLRMIVVWADITASLTWWKQFDTYRAGIEKVSTSTMHTFMKHLLSEDDFEQCTISPWNEHMVRTVRYLNNLIACYNTATDYTEKRRIWECAIQALPSSFLQKRTVMMSYAALRNIVKQRMGHKLNAWTEFIEWCKTLPESWMIFE